MNILSEMYNMYVMFGQERTHYILEVTSLWIRIQEFLWRILQRCKMRHFSTLWLVSLEVENSSDVHENIIA